MPEIFAAPSLEALEGVIIRNARDFNHDHVAASIARLASLMGAETGADQSVGRPREGPARKRELAQAQRLLSGLCSALLRFPATVSARQITTGLRTLALLAPQDSEDLSLQLCKLLVAGDGRRMEAAEGMEAVLIAWALVKLPNGVPEPAAAYTEALVAEADGPKRGGGGGDAAAGPSDPTDTEQRDAIYRRLWQLLAIAAVRLAPSMERGLGTMLWSFGRAHQDQDGRLAEALATRAADTAPFLMARDLVPMTFAYAQHHVRRQRGVEAQWRQQLADLQGLHGPSGARAIERLRAVLPRAVKNLLPELLSWQLAALLASLRLAGISDPELIQMALPQVVDAAKHYGSTSHLAPRPWNVSWQHLSQLAVGCLPLGVKAADLAVAGSAVDTDATGESLDGGGGFDAAGHNDEEQAREDELAAALTTAAAAAAKGGAAAAPQSHAAARAAISAVAAAAQRLMQREQERSSRC
ncbi:hypothetical protein MNEG_4750 [Monoraphidium neglectum]|uniref:Uncharacterized protein n=1 Tax=Monoraphidium neglectum TaxID=145388 RepID=A0A0D2JX75_9CHLO|nr:hypothetical protein MNEG_4750 [Monoraphidium neglectum]KIZ03213.1 hypothetical protein MNEG_4750 [Monoraphidium neglectum]|eukprot:XP_013902232.1 hypothetical protein MNEG_4750 [Monoraphidium neglectum]